jgi:hypothetical protein
MNLLIKIIKKSSQLIKAILVQLIKHEKYKIIRENNYKYKSYKYS